MYRSWLLIHQAENCSLFAQVADIASTRSSPASPPPHPHIVVPDKAYWSTGQV